MEYHKYILLTELEQRIFFSFLGVAHPSNNNNNSKVKGKLTSYNCSLMAKAIAGWKRKWVKFVRENKRVLRIR